MPVLFNAIPVEDDYKGVFGSKKVVTPHHVGAAMNGWKIQGYWYKSVRRFLNALAQTSISWCTCVVCRVEESKKDRRSVTLCFGGRKSFGGDFDLVFRADRPGRVYMRNEEKMLQRIMVHEPIQTVKTFSSRSIEEKKDGRGDWMGTCDDGTTMYPGPSWPREFTGFPADETYATTGGREPPSFGPSIPSLDKMADNIRVALGDGELGPEEVTAFIATLTLSLASSSSFSSSSFSPSSSSSSSSTVAPS